VSELDASQVEPYLAAQLPARIPVDELIRHGSSFCLSGPGPGADFGGSRYFGGDLVAICLHQSGGDPDVLTRLVGAAGLRPRQDLPSRARRAQAVRDAILDRTPFLQKVVGEASPGEIVAQLAGIDAAEARFQTRRGSATS